MDFRLSEIECSHLTQDLLLIFFALIVMNLFASPQQMKRLMAIVFLGNKKARAV
jgi:hypothetical protein